MTKIKKAIGVRACNAALVKRETGEKPVRTRHCMQCIGKSLKA